MAVIKCKMCGGDLDISEGLSVCECEYCGTKQTVPTADNEKKLTLFARANRLRLANEFDKAAGVYESIVADFPEEAEAYWGLVLCRYGIEYVDDPVTGKKVPTCHRVSFDSVMEDADFEQACENADAIARRQYREEAKAFEDIRRGIIEVSGKEEPYDIFICYKETAEDGDRTIDSVIAQDVYDALTDKGYRVFFSRISLEDKLGTEYEPYIFAALNSAKIMLAFGTDYEYYNAVWVKNEWSRFLKLMEKDKSKHLIPCYKNLDPYDMPKEFQRLQGQDMGKVGAAQDLLRGIEKILPRRGEETTASAQPVVQQIVQQVVQGGGPNVDALLQRGKMALEDGEWEKAREFFNQALNIESQCAEAYLGLVLTNERLQSEEAIGTLYEIKQRDAIENNFDFKKFLRFASEERRAQVKALLEKANVSPEQIAAIRAERFKKLRSKYKPLQGIIAAGKNYSVGVRSDGKAVASTIIKTTRTTEDKGQCNVSDWKDVVAAAAGAWHSIGLLADGTVVAAGSSFQGQCNVSSWKDIVAISARGFHTVGLHTDGTVVAAGENSNGQCDLNDWRDIIEISAGDYHTVGLRKNGTVIATKIRESDSIEDNGQSDVEDWKDIVAVAAGYNRTIGLKEDGTVVIAGNNSSLRDVEDWSGVIAVTAGLLHVVGLREDGTVIAAGRNDNGQCNVSDWKNIVAITAGEQFTLGLQEDGTVVAAGDNNNGQCSVGNWKLFRDINTLKQEQEQRRLGALTHMKEEALRKQKTIPLLSKQRDQYRKLQGMMTINYWSIVALKADGTVYTANFEEDIQSKVNTWQGIVEVAAGEEHVVGLKYDGTVVAVGNNDNGQCEVNDWTGITAVAAARYFTVALRADGIVLIAGAEEKTRQRLSEWADIKLISLGYGYIVGLKKDGTVVASAVNEEADNYIDDGQCEVSSWSNIVSIFAREDRTFGLRSDGQWIATGSDADKISSWSDIVEIASDGWHTVGLRVDGTVVATGKSQYRSCDVARWTDIVSVVTGDDSTVGLKSDGTVVAVGQNDCNQCNVGRWKNVCAVMHLPYDTIGIRSDGTLITTNENLQKQIADWKLFESLDSIETERKEGLERAAKEDEEAKKRAESARRERIAVLEEEKKALNNEHSSMKGLFSGKRRKEIELRLAEIDAEMKKLN